MVYNIYNCSCNIFVNEHFVNFNVDIMKMLECFDKRSYSRLGSSVTMDNFYIVKGNKTRTRKGYKRQYYIKGKLTNNEWAIAFLSYDKLGYVFKSKNSNRWNFTGIVNRCLQVYSRKINWNSHYWNSFEFNLQLGIIKEKQVKQDLETLFENPFNVYLLARSGAGCHGTDIIITAHNGDEYSDFHLRTENRFQYIVCSSICAFEVFGITYRGKNKDIPYFNSANKDIMQYMKELEDNKVIPFIAWVIDDTVWYMPLTSETVNAVFFTRRGGKYRQRTNYAPVTLAEPFKIDNKQLYELILSKSRD